MYIEVSALLFQSTSRGSLSPIVDFDVADTSFAVLNENEAVVGR
jgi:hypothetical protein